MPEIVQHVVTRISRSPLEASDTCLNPLEVTIVVDFWTSRDICKNILC